MVLNLLQRTVSLPMSFSPAAGKEKGKLKAQMWAQCSQGQHQLTRRGTAVLCESGPLGHPMRFCCWMLNFFWFRQEERRMGTSSHERRHQGRFVLFEAPMLLCLKKLKYDCWRQEQGSSWKTAAGRGLSFSVWKAGEKGLLSQPWASLAYTGFLKGTQECQCAAWASQAKLFYVEANRALFGGGTGAQAEPLLFLRVETWRISGFISDTFLISPASLG